MRDEGGVTPQADTPCQVLLRCTPPGTRAFPHGYLSFRLRPCTPPRAAYLPYEASESASRHGWRWPVGGGMQWVVVAGTHSHSASVGRRPRGGCAH